MSDPGSHDICIVGLKCYDLLANKAVPKYLGGIERILVAFARTLSNRGLRVAFITYDEGQPAVQAIDGITVIKAHRADAGLPLVRLVFPRMSAIWKAMKQARAPIYLQMGAGVETLASVIGVRLLRSSKAEMVYCTASNMDCEKELSGISTAHEKRLYKLALRRVDKVVCQTQTQAKMLRDNYNIESTVIPMSSDSSGGTKSQVDVRRPPAELNLLWVGRTVEVKRLEWYLDLAEKLPEAVLHIAGSANQQSSYARTQWERAATLSNVVLHGRVSDEELFTLYDKAFALCCTSIIEGFPTTFMEAWKIGLPVVTTFDPDNIIRESGAGVAAQNVDELADAVRAFHQDHQKYEAASRKGLQLYESRFSPDAIVGDYLKLLGIQQKS